MKLSPNVFITGGQYIKHIVSQTMILHPNTGQPINSSDLPEDPPMVPMVVEKVATNTNEVNRFVVTFYDPVEDTYYQELRIKPFKVGDIEHRERDKRRALKLNKEGILSPKYHLIIVDKCHNNMVIYQDQEDGTLMAAEWDELFGEQEIGREFPWLNYPRKVKQEFLQALGHTRVVYQTIESPNEEFIGL